MEKHWGGYGFFYPLHFSYHGRSLLAYKGLSTYATTLMDEVRAIDISYEANLDLDDAIQYHVASVLKADGIVSFDTHFNGLKISRLEPSQIL